MKHYEDDAIISELCRSIHEDNVKAGWWTDLGTGESILETRNRAEMLMLTVSELSEASYGFHHDLDDDHLPEYDMFDVELADAAIRLADQIGSLAPTEFGFTVGGCHIRGKQEMLLMRGASIDAALMVIVNTLSRAMEHHRKQRITEYRYALWDALLTLFRFADMRGVDLFAVIEAKRGYNRIRKDHQLLSRQFENGKKY